MDHMEYGLEFCEKTLIPTIKNVVDKYVGCLLYTSRCV